MALRRIAQTTWKKQGKSTTTRRIRRDKGQIQMTKRDSRALVWIGEQYGARLDQICRLLGNVSMNAVRHLVRRWGASGFVDTLKILAHEPAWVFLTEWGLRALLTERYRMWRPTPATIRHYAHVNWVRLRIEAQHPSGRWISERALLRHRTDRRGHCADGVLEATGKMIAVEVELTPKPVSEIEVTLITLAAEYDLVWYFVTPVTRRRVERALLQLTPVEQRIYTIIDLEEER
jgi:hypothetical protein